jgi:hypothetical protein
MPFVQLSSSTRYLFAGQSGMKQGKIDWGIRDGFREKKSFFSPDAMTPSS